MNILNVQCFGLVWSMQYCAICNGALCVQMRYEIIAHYHMITNNTIMHRALYSNTVYQNFKSIIPSTTCCWAAVHSYTHAIQDDQCCGGWWLLSCVQMNGVNRITGLSWLLRWTISVTLQHSHHPQGHSMVNTWILNLGPESSSGLYFHSACILFASSGLIFLILVGHDCTLFAWNSLSLSYTQPAHYLHIICT